MGQKSNFDRLPKKLRDKMLVLCENPAMTQAEITKAINAEAGKQVITRSSTNRFFAKMLKEKHLASQTKVEKSLFRIAEALEQIATLLAKGSS
jgi:t-SNARE complex subunit (syntaxin)